MNLIRIARINELELLYNHIAKMMDRLIMIRHNLMIKVRTPKDIKKILEIYQHTNNPRCRELLEIYDEERPV